MKYYRLKKQLFIIIIFLFSLAIIYQIKREKSNIVKIIEINYKFQSNYSLKPTLSTNGVLCVVLTSEQNIITRGIPVWETYGHELEDNIVFACNCPRVIAVKNLIEKNEEIPEELAIYKKVVHLPILNINVTEDVKKMGKKVLIVLKDAYETYKNHSNWYFMVDDDSFVFIDNLKKFIQSKNTSEPYMYGFKFNHLPKPGGHIAGGPGILLTNESMRRIVDKIDKNECEPYIDHYGDATIGGCGYHAGVLIANSSDDKGRPRFHVFGPKTHFYGPVPPYLYELGVHDKKIGKDCCSLETIGFHYVTIDEMHEMHRNKNYLKDFLS
jgi:hypothetical protein